MVNLGLQVDPSPEQLQDAKGQVFQLYGCLSKANFPQVIFSAFFKEFKFFGGKASFRLKIIEVEEERDVVMCSDNKREP
jgi:hypothetical protein